MNNQVKNVKRFQTGYNDTHHYLDVKKSLSQSTVKEIENYHKGVDEDELSLITPSVGLTQEELIKIIREWNLPEFIQGDEIFTVVTYDWLDEYRLGGHGSSSWGFMG